MKVLSDESGPLIVDPVREFVRIIFPLALRSEASHFFFFSKRRERREVCHPEPQTRFSPSGVRGDSGRTGRLMLLLLVVSSLLMTTRMLLPINGDPQTHTSAVMSGYRS